MVNWLSDVSEVDRPGSSSASVAGLLMAKMGGDGEAWHWVLDGGGYGPLLRYLHLAAHCPSDKSGHLFSIIGTKLSGVRSGSPIFSRAVIASSWYSQNARHLKRVCQASSSRPLLSQLEHSGLSASFMRNR